MNNNGNVSEAPGAKEDVDIAQISKWLEKDLNSMVVLLDAIRHDTELRLYMATWFYGRMKNREAKEALNNGKN